MRISIVIPAHNEEAHVGRCIESILAHGGEDVCEIIVVDNASTDRTAQVAAAFAKVRVVHEPKKGSNSARQRGFLEAAGDLVAFLDADSRISDRWLHVLRSEFAAHPGMVCLSGPYRYEGISPIAFFWTWYVWGTTSRLAQFFTGHMIAGTNFVAKREALEKIGGFDTSIPFYGDDVNLGRRLGKVGPMRFVGRFFVYTSGRRIAEYGLLKINWIYGMNYLWEMLFHRPYTKTAEDIR
jgi:glycosyltransferase involved in cell wall biosynthesis